MDEYLVYYRYNGKTNVLRLQAESEEEARERMLVLRADKDEPSIHCNGHPTPMDELALIKS